MRCRNSGLRIDRSKGESIGVLYPEGADPTKDPTGGHLVVALRCNCGYREVWKENREGWLADRPLPEVFAEHEEEN